VLGYQFKRRLAPSVLPTRPSMQPSPSYPGERKQAQSNLPWRAPSLQ
jgi:hypothetical protein